MLWNSVLGEKVRVRTARAALRWPASLALGAVLVLGSAYGVQAIVKDLALVGSLHEPRAEHVDQMELADLARRGLEEEAFELAFEEGDELFETVFNALDGAGARVGRGQRFTRVPRADLDGAGEWANHLPRRTTGPNAEACNHCHRDPFDDGSGGASANVHRDPLHTGRLGSFIQRNTPHLFAPGAVQRLAEEMTESLHAIRDAARDEACREGRSTKGLSAKGVSFGVLRAFRLRGRPCEVRFDTSRVVGVDPDLVVRPFQWKGSIASVREFNRDASHNELGMQSVEIVGEGVDGDFDGVADEMTVGDQTALAVYLSAQPRPSTRVELAVLGLIPPLSSEELEAISRGSRTFGEIGCASCHRPTLRINRPIFSEPSQNPHYRDEVFPAGQDPVALGVDPRSPVTFDLTRDQPDNRLEDANGNVFRLGSLRTDDRGRGLVDLYGDLKRHDMGPGLAEPIDEVGTGNSVFLTENLWGVGSTAPYLHDGRATTLAEAILAHGGEAGPSRERFAALEEEGQQALIAFLENLVLFKVEEEE